MLGLCVGATVLSPRELQLGVPLARGNFGSVRWARQGSQLCVAKSASVLDSAAMERAVEYLEVEADINRLLAERMPHEYLDQRSVPPYLGRVVVDGEKHLIFEACGSHTLDTFLQRGDAGRRDLCAALGLPQPDPAADSDGGGELSRRVLHDTLSCLAFVHARGVVHRDVKPENLLVDTEHCCLRLLDFGSACDAAGWVRQRGYHPDRVPCSILYVPPEEALDLRSPYTFDVYSAALVYLSVAVPVLGTSESALYELRLQLRDYRHDPVAWRESAERAAAIGGAEGQGPGSGGGDGIGGGDGSGGGGGGSSDSSGEATLPAGWEAAFGTSGRSGGETPRDRPGDRAWELLTQLIALDPAQRPTAAEALLSPFLNADCSTNEVAMPAREPWSVEATLEAAIKAVNEALGGGRGKRNQQLDRRVLEADECALPYPADDGEVG